ncbi:MAG: DNA replication and repair protein RecF [Acidobacteria bacterium]|nr:DNA replication and repair protein RecF [Acidobacteriota bacterium]
MYTEGFRNLSGKLTACPGINILCGDNAQGKTNWLEAIYLLASTKSFRTSTLKDTLRLNPSSQNNQNTKQAYVRGSVIKERLKKDLQVQLEETTKSFYVNGKREAVTRYIGNLDVVVFCAEEMEIVRGEPSERRRFLDRGVLSLFPSYLKTLSEYNRILKQKNVLLKQAQENPQPKKFFDLIETWNEQLADYSTQIHMARLDYTNRLRKVLNKQLFSQKQVDIRYVSALSSHGVIETTTRTDYQKIITERLGLRMENEVSAGYSLIGPHRDEMEILIDTLEAGKFGSAGEQRSALITLDLAQISVYHQAFEEYPVFLIDDIDAELDLNRISLLLNHLADKMQVFISTSKREIAHQYQSKALCNFISQGNVVKALENSINNDSINTINKTEIKLEEAEQIKELKELKELAQPTTELAVAPILKPNSINSSKLEENLSVKTPPSQNTVSLTEEESLSDSEDRHRAPF